MPGDSELDKNAGAESAVPFAAVSDPVSDEVEEFLSRDADFKAAAAARDKASKNEEPAGDHVEDRIADEKPSELDTPAEPALKANAQTDLDANETLVADPLPSDIEHFLLDLSQSLTILDNESVAALETSTLKGTALDLEPGERLITLKDAPKTAEKTLKVEEPNTLEEAPNEESDEEPKIEIAEKAEPEAAPKTEIAETVEEPQAAPKAERAETVEEPEAASKAEIAEQVEEPETAPKAELDEAAIPKAPAELADSTVFADPLPADIESFLVDLNQSLTSLTAVEEQPGEDLLLELPEAPADEAELESSPIDMYTKLRQVEEDIERALRGHRENVPLEPAHLPPPLPPSKPAETGKDQSVSQRFLTTDENRESLSSTNTRLRAASAAAATGPKGFVTGANLDPSQTVSVERASVDSWLLGFGFAGIVLVGLLAYAVFGTYNAESHYKAGLSALSHDEVDSAILEFSACLKSDPGWRPAYLYRALAYSRQGKAEKAIEDYNKILEKEPDNVKAYLGRASQYLQMGEYEKVKFDCNDALRLDPVRNDAYRLKAAAEARNDQYQDAIADCREYLQHPTGKEKPSDMADAWATLALAHEKTKDYRAAVSDFNKAIEMEPANALLYAGRAENYKNLKDWKSASTDASKALELKPELNLYALRSQCYEALGQKDSALTDLNNAIKRSPFNLALYRERGNLYLAKQDVPHAIADFNFVLERNPEDKEAKAKLDLATGKLSSTKKLVIADVSDANDKPGAAVSVSANADPATLIKAGYAQLQRGETADAVTTLSAAVTKNPNDKQGRRYLAHALSMSGRAAEAAQQFTVLASMTTLEPADQLAFATALDKAGELEAAIPRYESYIGARPDDSHARLSLIDAYARGPSRQKAMRLAADSVSRARSAEERQLFENAMKNLQQGLPVQPPARSQN